MTWPCTHPELCCSAAAFSTYELYVVRCRRRPLPGYKMLSTFLMARKAAAQALHDRPRAMPCVIDAYWFKRAGQYASVAQLLCCSSVSSVQLCRAHRARQHSGRGREGELRSIHLQGRAVQSSLSNRHLHVHVLAARTAHPRTAARRRER